MATPGNDGPRPAESLHGSASTSPPAAFPIKWQVLHYIHPVGDNLLCSMCKLPMHEPVTTIPCQHTVCSACLVDELVRTNMYNGRARCPVCQAAMSVQQHGAFFRPADPAYEEQLAALVVTCPAPFCRWAGSRGTLEASHAATCDYTLVGCIDDDCSGIVIRGAQAAADQCLHHQGVCRLCNEIIDDMAHEIHHRAKFCRGSATVPPTGAAAAASSSRPDPEQRLRGLVAKLNELVAGRDAQRAKVRRLAADKNAPLAELEENEDELARMQRQLDALSSYVLHRRRVINGEAAPHILQPIRVL